MVRDLDHSLPLDVHIWSEHPEVHNLIDALWTTHFSDFDPDTGAPGRRGKGHPKRQLRVLILDLYVAWAMDPNLSIGVSMTNSSYHPNSRYNALHISRVVIPLIHRAHDLGLIGFLAGSEYAERTSRIWAEQPLIDHFQKAKFGLLDIGSFIERESIILSIGEKSRREYDDTAEIIAARQRMDAYNQLMNVTFVDVPALTKPVIMVPSKTEGKEPSALIVSQNHKFSKRVYYRGSWDLGGRIHGGFWQRMPKEWRTQLFINDLPTVEDDYSGLHPALLYGMEGGVIGGDPYTLDMPSKFDAKTTREVVKTLVLVAINASSEKSAFKAFRQKQDAGSMLKRLTNAELSVVLETFKARHPAMARYMCSDMGVTLMAIDGRITDRIIGQFTRENVPVLTVFDSYIVDSFHEKELRSAMIKAMDDEVPGASTSFKITGRSYDQLVTQADGDFHELLTLPQRLLSGVIKSEGYRYRRDQFSAWRSKQPGWDHKTHVQGGIDLFIGSMWSESAS